MGIYNYRMTNWNLNMTAARIAAVIQDEGFSAGLGWIGRNNLLVHPKWGSKIRIVTILTDISLETDKPIERDCGNCRQCIEICPVKASKDSNKDWNKEACLTKLKYYAQNYGVGQYIFGL